MIKVWEKSKLNRGVGEFRLGSVALAGTRFSPVE